jgi:hypothetical protein
MLIAFQESVPEGADESSAEAPWTLGKSVSEQAGKSKETVAKLFWAPKS